MKTFSLFCIICFFTIDVFAQTELVTNGGFETATSSQLAPPWQFDVDFYVGINFTFPHAGSKNYAYAGADINGTIFPGLCDGLLSQSIYIPNGTVSATLTFWVYISTDESPTAIFDRLGVWWDAVNIAWYSNLDATSGYVKKTLTLSVAAYQGKSVLLQFSQDADSRRATVFRIDDVSIQATVSQPSLSVTPDTRSVGSSAGSSSFGVSNSGTGSMVWSSSVTSGSNWLSITSGSSGTNSGTINCSYPANTSTSQRTGTITITASGAQGSPKSVTVVQDGVQGPPILSVSPDYIDMSAGGGATNLTVTNSGSGVLTYTSTSTASWLTITSGENGNLSGGNSNQLNISTTANSGTDTRTGTITVTASGVTGSPKSVTVTQNPSGIIVGQLKLSGDQITGTAPNYTISGNISIGHKDLSGYLVKNLSGQATCNTSTKTISMASGASFTIPSGLGWDWKFYQTQNWNFKPDSGIVTISSQIRLTDTSIINLVSTSFNLNFFKKSIYASAKILGNKYLEYLGSFNASIDLTQTKFEIRALAGTNVPLGPMRLGILENSAGVTFNVLDKKIEFDATIGKLVSLKLIGVDGAEFSFTPYGSLSLGLEWDFQNYIITFTKDSEFSLGLSKKNIEQMPDSVFQHLLKAKKIHYGTGENANQLVLDVGLTIKEGSYVDFDKVILSGKASLDIKWLKYFKVSALSVSLNLNYPESFISGQILSPGISIGDNGTSGDWFSSNQNELSFEYHWGNMALNIYPKYVFIGRLNSLLPPLLPSIDARLESRYGDTPPKLFGSLMSCFHWMWMPFCAGVDVTISSEGVKVGGTLVLNGTNRIAATSSTSDSVLILASPYTKTVTGVFVNETTIPQTNIKLKPLSSFNFIYDSTANNAGDLHVSSTIDGTNLTWNYQNINGQMNSHLSNFTGLSLALASKADLKVQSTLNSNKYVEIKNDGGIVISHFSNVSSYYSPDTTLGNNKMWKIVRIYSQDSTEAFSVMVTPKSKGDTLLFTMIKGDPTTPNNILFARYNTAKMDSNSYTLNVSPKIMNYTFTNSTSMISPFSIDNVHTQNGLLAITQIQNSWTESSFNVSWSTTDSTKSVILYGPSIALAVNTVSDNHMLTEHSLTIPGNSIDSGWVYQIQSTNSSQETATSEWRMLFLDRKTSVNEQPRLPIVYGLSQNFPNPFNPSTRIKFAIPKASYVSLKIFDVLGREVNTLVNEEESSGFYEVSFNAMNLPAGIYFYTIKAGEFVQTKKMILLK